MKKIIITAVFSGLFLTSCGPKRLGCGPRRCEVKTPATVNSEINKLQLS